VRMPLQPAGHPPRPPAAVRHSRHHAHAHAPPHRDSISRCCRAHRPLLCRAGGPPWRPLCCCCGNAWRWWLWRRSARAPR
jgi:hypothetical protein